MLIVDIANPVAATFLQQQDLYFARKLENNILVPLYQKAYNVSVNTDRVLKLWGARPRGIAKLL